MEPSELPLPAALFDGAPARVRPDSSRRESLNAYVARVSKAVARHADGASYRSAQYARDLVGRKAPSGHRIVAASPYTALTRKGEGQGETVAIVPEIGTCDCGPWLLAEAQQHLKALRASYARAKEFEQRCVVGLVLLHNEAHVVEVEDPEADVRVNPKFLIDGLGRWPAVIYWSKRSGASLCIATEDTRYFIAPVRRPD